MNKINFIFNFLVLITFLNCKSNSDNKKIEKLDCNKVSFEYISENSKKNNNLIESVYDSTSLTNKERFNSIFEFSKEQSIINFVLKNEGNLEINFSFHSKNICGCSSEDPKLLFVNSRNEPYELSLIGDSQCENLFYMGFMPTQEATITVLLIELQNKQIDKIRLIKNENSYIDMFLNDNDKNDLKKFADFSLKEIDELLAN